MQDGNNFIDGKKLLDKLTEAWRENKTAIDTTAEALNKANKEYANLPSEYIKTQKQIIDIQTKQAKKEQELNKIKKERDLLTKSLERQVAKLSLAESKSNRERVKAAKETQLLNQRAREYAVISSKLSTEYQKQSTVLIQLRRKYKDLALTQGENSKEAKRLIKEIRTLDNRLKRVDASVGQFQRNVGNYPFRQLSSGIMSLMSAFGFVGGIYIFVDAITDAFKRVREFDKEMQNMAGILRVNRDELKGVESEIIKVAGSSVTTSNEVAKMASALFTLGKSREEVVKLLKPVNDLSIGLNTNADEAGEFLVQMLNAFGASTDEAGKYADTIATIRTSTSLDFQRMRDSFAYIAPISRLLNKDLAYTGSVVGILADNSIKAESAGRLLSTAQIKLANEGKTLNQALEEINQAYREGKRENELLAIAGNLFGAQAAKIGAILAKNTDAIEENAQAIRDNGGALEDLTNQQLKSWDAKIKIANSSLEKFILNLDNGGNILGVQIKKGLDGFSDTMERLTYVLDGNVNTFDKWILMANQSTKAIARNLFFIEDSNGLFAESAEKIIKDTDERKANAIAIEEQNRAFVKLNGSLAPLNKEMQEISDTSDPFIPLVYSSNKLAEANKKTALTYSEIQDKIKEQQDLLKESTAEEAPAINKEISRLQKLAEAWENKAKKQEKAIEAVKGSIVFQQQVISQLEDEQSKLANNSREYGRYSKQIQDAKDQLELLNIALGKVKVNQLKSAEGDLFGAGVNLVDQLGGFDLEGKDAEFNEYFDRLKDLKNREIELEKATAEEKREIYQGLANAGINLANALFQARVSKIDAEIEKNNEYYDDLLSNQNLSEQERERLQKVKEQSEKKLEEKKKKELRKQAIFNKAAALAEIGINTAVAITKTLAGTGFLGIPLTSIIAAIGALQAATVIATPLPAFAKGTDNAPEGLAITQEKGAEMITDKFGNIKTKGTNKGAQLTYLNKGDKVFTAPETKAFFNPMEIQRATFMASLESNNRALNTYETAKMFDATLGKMKDEVKTGIEEGLKGFKSNVKVNNNIDFKYITRLARKGL